MKLKPVTALNLQRFTFFIFQTGVPVTRWKDNHQPLTIRLVIILLMQILSFCQYRGLFGVFMPDVKSTLFQVLTDIVIR